MEVRNRRQLADDAYDVMVSPAANADLSDGVSSGDDYLDVFPYLASPKDPDPNLPPLVPREGG